MGAGARPTRGKLYPLSGDPALRDDSYRAPGESTVPAAVWLPNRVVGPQGHALRSNEPTW